MSDEQFSHSDVSWAIQQFLQWGENEYGKSQQGYFSGDGWAARVLRYHLVQLRAQQGPDDSYN